MRDYRARSHDCGLCRFLCRFGKTLPEAQGEVYARPLATDLSSLRRASSPR